jgi:peroxiredoxin
MRLVLLTACFSAALATACEKPPPSEPARTNPETPEALSTKTTQEAPSAQLGLRGDARTAEIGKRAPDFVLPQLDGEPVTLSAHAGKPIVLEWFNPGCPFVNLAHTKGPLKGTAARHAADGVVWIAVNSGAKGKQGHDPEENRAAKARFGLDHPIVLDPTGEVGKAYGAQRTPHLFVIDESFTLVYAGAADNSPDAEGESPTDDKLINYLDSALNDVASKRPVKTPRTDAYGCTVKYGD